MQAIVASLVLALGMAWGSAYLRDRMLEDRMASEAAHLWDAIERDPQARLSSGMGIDSWLLADGEDITLPRELQGLEPGFRRLPGGERLAHVSERDGRRLVLTLEPRTADKIVLYTSLLALLLAVAGIIVIVRFGYRYSKAAVAPVVRLADALVHWDPGTSSEEAFDRTDGGDEPVAEVEQLRASLRTVSGRMHEYIERERDFTRDASHELRTPLTVVRVAADLLRQEPALSERGARSLRRIDDAVREMEELVDAFLMLARHPDVPLDLEEIDVAAVAHEEAAQALPWLEGKPVVLEVVERAQPHVQAPPRALGVVLSQLLRNACAHTDTGRIELRVEADRIEVEDTGSGMDAATLARAFRPFFRGAGNEAAGKGLGLHVVQRLATRLGWSVELRSTPGIGTAATLRFPG